ncbi:MAG: hypothetical protein R2716_08040 [Microthrixaceae bacterium]
MVVAEFEAFFSRPVAPTRRIAIGRLRLPDDGEGDAATAAAAMLLGGVLAAFARSLEEDELSELHRLIDDVENGRRIAQPRMRHRLQADRVGLRRSTNRLVRDSSGVLHLRLDHTNGTRSQHSLAAVYSAAALEGEQRRTVAAAMRVGLEWAGAADADLLAVLSGRRWHRDGGRGPVVGDPVGWALGVLDLVTPDGRPHRKEIQRAFRSALRSAHPDHGAPLDGAADRIAELDAARRILLG